MRHAALFFAPYSARRRRGFTVMELLLVVLILSIMAMLGADAIASFESAQRPDRAARESLAFFRCARSLSMTTGKKAKVTINTTNRTVSIYWQSNGSTYDATPYATGMTASGTALLNLNNNRELVGTTVAVNPASALDYEYSPLGTCAQTGTITFTYAGKSKSLVVVNVGDPQLP